MPDEESDPLVTPRERQPRPRGRIAVVANWFVCALRFLGGIPNDSPTQGEPVTPDRRDTDTSIEQEAGILRETLFQIFFNGTGDVDGTDSFSTALDELRSEIGDWILLNEDNINTLIDRLGNQVVEQTDGYGRSLTHHTVSEGALDCAKILFHYAADERIHVDPCCNDGDILKTALEKYSRESVQFVLERMAMRCASARQTIEVLSRNLSELLRRFPDIFERFLVDDKLCFALGKLSVPKSIFDGTDTKPIGFICDYDPGELKWKMHYESEVRQFLKDQCPRLQGKIGGTEGEIITAVLKFVPLEDVVVSGRKMSIADMTAAKCSVDVFKCETIKCNVHWKWHNYLRSKFLFSNVMYLISVAFFFVFATYYGDIANDTEAWNVSDLTGDFGEANQTLARC